MQIVYVGPFDEIEVFGVGSVKRNESLSVSSDVAGRAPSGDPDTDDYDPGVGLLAQPSNWQPAAKSKSAAKDDEVTS